jgi:hypothetical protein
VAVAIVFALVVFLHVDVSRRGRIVADQIHWHRTDFTVFTEAGAAFFDGRDPYAVKNPRGWFYLYPPLFALMVAPLAALDSTAQVGAWYVVSVVLGFGCFFEMRRLWRFVAEEGSGTDRSSGWIAACAGLTVLLPSIECLQRGQVGIALLYALLLGYRLVLAGAGRSSVFLGGLVLAWAVVVKLIPALPVGFLIWQRLVAAIRAGRDRCALERAGVLSLGVIAGGLLFVLAIPALALGWNANLRHLETWTHKVVTNVDPGQESKFHIDSATNQSFANASHLLASHLRTIHPDDPALLVLRFAKTPEELRWAQDTATANLRRADRTTERIVRGTVIAMLALLLGLGIAPARDDRLGQAAAFGLACLAMLLVSPVAWTHYEMMALPAVVAVPLWLDRRGYPKTARWMASVPVALVWSHYLSRQWAGQFGLLGLGIAAWFLACGTLVLAIELRGTRTARGLGPPKLMWSGRAAAFTKGDSQVAPGVSR